LPPHGLLIISTPNTLRYKGAVPPRENDFHLNEPDYRTFVDWLEPWFEIEGEWEQSPVIDRHSSICLRSLSKLDRLLTYRAIRKIETLLRNLFVRPPVPGDPQVEPQEAVTDILPLLPERRAACDVFLFVCRRKS
jgi:hypothetical protein